MDNEIPCNQEHGAKLKNTEQLDIHNDNFDYSLKLTNLDLNRDGESDINDVTMIQHKEDGDSNNDVKIKESVGLIQTYLNNRHSLATAREAITCSQIRGTIPPFMRFMASCRSKFASNDLKNQFSDAMVTIEQEAKNVVFKGITMALDCLIQDENQKIKNTRIETITQLREKKEAGFAAENNVAKFNTKVDNIKTKLDNDLAGFTASLKNNEATNGEAAKTMDNKTINQKQHKFVVRSKQNNPKHTKGKRFQPYKK